MQQGLKERSGRFPFHETCQTPMASDLPNVTVEGVQVKTQQTGKKKQRTWAGLFITTRGREGPPLIAFKQSKKIGNFVPSEREGAGRHSLTAG